jgi:hypothetical protein
MKRLCFWHWNQAAGDFSLHVEIIYLLFIADLAFLMIFFSLTLIILKIASIGASE